MGKHFCSAYCIVEPKKCRAGCVFWWLAKKHNPQTADIFLLKTACLKKTDMLWKMNQICFMSDSSMGFPRVNLCKPQTDRIRDWSTGHSRSGKYRKKVDIKWLVTTYDNLQMTYLNTLHTSTLCPSVVVHRTCCSDKCITLPNVSYLYIPIVNMRKQAQEINLISSAKEE